MVFSRSRSAFTLIETVLYIGITAIVVVSLTRIMLTVTGTREKTNVLTDVQQEARFVLDRVTYTLRAATAVNTGSSVLNTNTGTLSLSMSGASTTPTVFSLSGSRVYVQEGSSAALPLTTERTLVDTLQFDDLSADNTNGTIRITLHATDSVAGNEDKTYVDDLTLSTAVTLRQ